MMMGAIIKWMEHQIKKHNISGKTLDIGSRDVNGNPRHLFTDYIGIDKEEGNNVDIVADAYNLQDILEKESFDNVLCLSVLEHMCDIRKILDNIYYVLKKGGYFFVSVPSIAFPLHEYPSDYWRFTEQAVKEFVMKDYDILYLKARRTKYNKCWIINCLGKKR